jgi:hypothetical protein
MFQAQGMAQLVHSHQKDIVPWRDGDGEMASWVPSLAFLLHQRLPIPHKPPGHVVYPK